MTARWCNSCGAAVPEGAIRCPRCFSPLASIPQGARAYEGTDYEEFIPIEDEEGGRGLGVSLSLPSRRAIGSLIGLVAVAVLAIALLTNAWYTIYLEDTWGGKPYREITMEYGLSEVRIELREREGDSWLEAESTVDYERIAPDEEHVKAAGWTELLGYHALLVAMVFAAVGFHLGRGWMRPGSDRLRRLAPIVLGMLAGVILMVGVIVFGVGFPEDAEDYFHYSLYAKPESSGFGPSFYLASASMLLLVLAAGLTMEFSPKDVSRNLPYTPIATGSTDGRPSPRAPSPRIIAGAFLGIVTIALIIMCLVTTNWYHIEAYRAPEALYSPEVDLDTDYGLHSVETRMDTSSVFLERTFQDEVEYEEFAQGARYAEIGNGVFYLFATGAVVSALFVAMALHSGTGRLNIGPTARRVVPFSMAYTAAALILVGFLYFVFGFPAAAMEPFTEDALITVETQGFGNSMAIAIAALFSVFIAGLLSIGPRPARPLG